MAKKKKLRLRSAASREHRELRGVAFRKQQIGQEISGREQKAIELKKVKAAIREDLDEIDPYWQNGRDIREAKKPRRGQQKPRIKSGAEHNFLVENNLLSQNSSAGNFAILSCARY